MSVYVDDAAIAATVQNGSRSIRGRWSHLVADSQDELHAFAARLGLRREWFQVPKGLGGRGTVNPTSRAAQNWHYDVTANKRAEAIRIGAVAVTSREMSAIIDARYEREQPEAAAKWRRMQAENDAKWAHLRDPAPTTTEDS